MSKRQKANSPRRESAPGFGRPSLPVSLGPALAYIALVSVVALVYAPALWGGLLLWDDGINVTGNPYLQPPSWSNLALLWREPYAGLYVPMTYSFLSAETLIANHLADSTMAPGTHAFLYHFGCLCLHVLNVSLVYLLGRRITASHWGGIVAGLWFGLHPLQVESVAWVTETKTLLSGFFSLVAIFTFLDAAKSIDGTKSTHRGRWIAEYSLASAAVTLALLAKPTAVAVPLIAGLCATWNRSLPLRQLFGWLFPWIGVAVAFSVLTARIQPTVAADMLPLWTRPFVAGDSLAFYLWKLFVPYPLAFDYGRTPAIALSGWLGYLAWMVPVLLAAFLATAPPLRVWLFPFAIFVAGLLPSLGLVPFTFQIFSTVADRYVYLAMLGPALGAGYWVARHPTKETALALSVFLAVFAILSHQQAQVWRDDVSLNEHGLTVNDQSRAGHNNLAAALLARGEPLRAVRHYESVFALATNDRTRTEALVGMGNALAQAGKLADALIKQVEAVRLSPDYPPAWLAMGSTLLQQGKPDQARAAFEEVIRQQPSLIEGHYNLALAWEALGNARDARRELERTLALQPNHAPTHAALGNLAYRAGDFPRAIEHFTAAMNIDPNQAATHFNLATTFARLGDTARAEAHFQQALRLDPRMENARRNLEVIRRSRGSRQGS